MSVNLLTQLARVESLLDAQQDGGHPRVQRRHRIVFAHHPSKLLDVALLHCMEHAHEKTGLALVSKLGEGLAVALNGALGSNNVAGAEAAETCLEEVLLDTPLEQRVVDHLRAHILVDLHRPIVALQLCAQQGHLEQSLVAAAGRVLALVVVRSLLVVLDSLFEIHHLCLKELGQSTHVLRGDGEATHVQVLLHAQLHASHEISIAGASRRLLVRIGSIHVFLGSLMGSLKLQVAFSSLLSGITALIPLLVDLEAIGGSLIQLGSFLELGLRIRKKTKKASRRALLLLLVRQEHQLPRFLARHLGQLC
eukprot:m.221738 g.221738  ORF g.221738 m.221738 type:complete len:308 (+) comp15874_c0_seq1:310-1233(+)